MIFWPLEFLLRQGYKHILFVVGRHGCGDLMKLCGSGSRFGAQFLYAFQEAEGGIAEALMLAEPFVSHKTRSFPVLLGDNIVSLKKKSLSTICWENQEYRTGCATVFCVQHDRPELFGVAVLGPEGRVLKIEEKPATAASPWVVTGLYVYDADVFEIIEKQCQRSSRGEMEISTVNDWYAQNDRLQCSMEIEEWIDCGTPQLYHAANAWAWQKEKA